jgi:bifunctional non-homologous end joining protein LigD
VLDVLMDDHDVLIHEPWSQRRERLEYLLKGRLPAGLRLSHVHRGPGDELLEEARADGLEGIIAKDQQSPYKPARRSRDWLKIKIESRQEFVVGGWTEPRNSRAHIGAILLGYWDDSGLTYAGHTGGGFTRAALRDMYDRLAPLESERSPFTTTPRTNEKPHWVNPEVVVEVKFNEWTSDGKLRQPIFVGVREDKVARSVVRERPLAVLPGRKKR